MIKKARICTTEEVAGILDGSLTEFGEEMSEQPREVNGKSVINSDNGWLVEQDIWGRYNPIGAVGDVLWIRESFIEEGDSIIYRADDPSKSNDWRPPLNMGEDKARVSVEIIESGARKENSGWNWFAKFKVIEEK